MKKKLVMLAETHGTASYVYKQLKVIFGKYVDVQIVIASSHLSPGSLSSDLVVIISKVLQDQMQTFIKPGTRVLVAERMIDPRQVIQLYDIPSGSDVLLVNTSPKVTRESIQQLIACGMDNLHYHSYYPGITHYKMDCNYAVTFGEPQLIPPGQYLRAMDLQTRPIGISTCVLIARELGIYHICKKTLSSLYMNPFIRMTHDLAVTSEQNRQISENLQNVMDRFEDGMLVLNAQGQVVLFNKVACHILKLKDGTSPILQQIFAQRELTDSFFYEIDGSNYYFEPVNSQMNNGKNTILTVRNISKIEHIESRYRRSLAEKGLVARYTFDDIIYKSPAMKKTVKIAKEFSKGESTVFLNGATGCGKEMLAQAIHNASPRKHEAFVAVNFASISSSLSESELFGYAEGAFTGAKRGGKPGFFALAHHGTIFLDEIGDAPLELQKKLLRVIQERQIMPVGDTKVIPVDVRIIAASNQNMGDLIRRHKFREDLYYRLNVLPLRVPPLRERPEDILPLFYHFLRDEFGIDIQEISPEMQEKLKQHQWKGNVRELHNVAEYISNFVRWDPNWEQQLDTVLQSSSDSPANTPYHSEFGPVLAKLEKHGDPRHFANILNILNSPPYCWSRAKIAAALNKQGKLVSDSPLKRDLLLLKEQGLINAVTGRGTFIREKGRQFLRESIHAST